MVLTQKQMTSTMHIESSHPVSFLLTFMIMVVLNAFAYFTKQMLWIDFSLHTFADSVQYGSYAITGVVGLLTIRKYWIEHRAGHHKKPRRK